MREALYDIYIYGEKGKAAPLIVMNTFQGNGSDVYSALCTMTEKELNLAVISDINWNEEMSPWECAPLYKNDSPYTGGADKNNFGKMPSRVYFFLGDREARTRNALLSTVEDKTGKVYD